MDSKREIEDIRQFCQSRQLQFVPILFSDLVFEERVSLACFYCGRYGNNWKCPPNIPKLDYKQALSEFENHALLHKHFSFNADTYQGVRTESTNVIHHALLEVEKILLRHGALSLSFQGGSCKLCKNGCGPLKCNNPYQARSPIEALGINVGKTAAKYGISVKWPVTDSLTRIGLVVW